MLRSHFLGCGSSESVLDVIIFILIPKLRVCEEFCIHMTWFYMEKRLFLT